MEANKQALETEAWRIASSLAFCLSKIIGRYTAYPNVDTAAFRRIHDAMERGLRRGRSSAKVRNFCQDLRAVTSCPIRELLRAEGADDTDARLVAIAQSVREHCGLDDELFRELLTGVLSWTPKDKARILETVVAIVRSAS
jgi:hypothetical protein